MITYKRERKKLIIPSGFECGGGCEEAIQEAYASGVTAQKNLLTSTAFTENGTYTRADGWNSVTVNTPTCNLAEAIIPLTQSFTGRTVINPDAPYNGFSKITIIDGGYGDSKYQSGYAEGLSSGKTEGYASGLTVGFESGITVGVQRKQITIRLEKSGLTIWGALESTYDNAIVVNGNRSEYCYVVDKGFGGNPSFIEMSGFSQDTVITTIELYVDWRYIALDSAPQSWDSTAYLNGLPYTIVSQSCEPFGTVGDGEYPYKYTLNFNNAGLYDKASYDAGLAACQNSENQ